MAIGVRQLKLIMKATPPSQAICLRGKHGIGKTQIIRSYWEDLGYRVFTLDGGQLQDVGDIAFPALIPNADGSQSLVHAKPDWWPKEAEKFILFIDEIVRVKKTLKNAMMRILLEQYLFEHSMKEAVGPNGDCRVMAAYNPVDNGDGDYFGEDFDDAQKSRLNVYEFIPEIQEWIDWANDNEKIVHPAVTQFINKNRTFLDSTPPATRRGWTRVGEIVNYNVEDPSFDILSLGMIIEPIVGSGAASQFQNFLINFGNNLSADDILLNWSNIKDIEKKVKKLKTTDIVNICDNIGKFLEDNQDGPEVFKLMGTNCKKFLDTITKECQAQFFTQFRIAKEAGKKWPAKLIKSNNAIANGFIEALKETTFNL